MPALSDAPARTMHPTPQAHRAACRAARGAAHRLGRIVCAGGLASVACAATALEAPAAFEPGPAAPLRALPIAGIHAGLGLTIVVPGEGRSVPAPLPPGEAELRRLAENTRGDLVLDPRGRHRLGFSLRGSPREGDDVRREVHGGVSRGWAEFSYRFSFGE